MKSKWILIILIIATFFTYNFTRFYNLNKTPVDDDTFSWFYRLNSYPWLVSSNLKGHDIGDKDLAYVGKLSYHPGVTIMTFSGISTKFGKNIMSQRNPEYKECAYLDYECEFLGFELFIAKLPLVVIGSALFGLSIFFFSKVFSVPQIFPWVLSILFEPLILSASQLLHLDFLFAIFAVSSIAALFYGVKFSFSWIKLFAGALMGFALLTRFAGGFLLLSVFAVLFYLQPIFKQFIKSSFLYALGIVTLFIGFYPPMWVAPVETITYIIESSIGISDNLAGTAPLYERYFSSLNWSLQRLVDVVSLPALGMIIAGNLALFWIPFKNRKYALSIFIIFIGYFAFINLADKQYVRYLVPVLIGVLLSGSIGIYYLLNLLYLKVKNSLLRAKM